jgi:hypothetical protein
MLVLSSSRNAKARRYSATVATHSTADTTAIALKIRRFTMRTF